MQMNGMNASSPHGFDFARTYITPLESKLSLSPSLQNTVVGRHGRGLHGCKV